MDLVTVDSAERIERARAVLTLAFADDPVTRWTLPTATTFLEGWPLMIDAFARDALAARTVWTVGEDDGVIVWLPPGAAVDADAMTEATREHFPSELRLEMEEFLGRLHAFEPEDDHWYLPLLGVDPGRRGQGIGSDLLGRTLARVDADRADAYLTSSNPRNVPLYLRHGFEVLGEVQVGSSPVMTPMVRRAR